MMGIIFGCIKYMSKIGLFDDFGALESRLELRHRSGFTYKVYFLSAFRDGDFKTQPQHCGEESFPFEWGRSISTRGHSQRRRSFDIQGGSVYRSLPVVETYEKAGLLFRKVSLCI